MSKKKYQPVKYVPNAPYVLGCQPGTKPTASPRVRKSHPTLGPGFSCKTKDIRGMKFGRIVVKEIAEFRDANGHLRWICQCECGNLTASTAGNLMNGSTNSCGCLKYELSLNSMVLDLTGHRYGRLTVISRVRDGNPVSRWLCKCDCGGAKIMSTGSLRDGGVRSCGCLAKEWSDKAIHLCHAAIKRLPFGVSRFNVLFKRYASQAARRGFSFDLTAEDCQIFFSSKCAYCGIEPSQVCSQPGSNGYYVYNGIDRKNPLIGYSLDNCVAACKWCNYAKRNLSFEEWNEWMDRMAAWRLQGAA